MSLLLLDIKYLIISIEIRHFLMLKMEYYLAVSCYSVPPDPFSHHIILQMPQTDII